MVRISDMDRTRVFHCSSFFLRICQNTLWFQQLKYEDVFYDIIAIHHCNSYQLWKIVIFVRKILVQRSIRFWITLRPSVLIWGH